MSKYELYILVDNYQKKLIRRLPLYLAKEKLQKIIKKGLSKWII